MLSKIVRFEQRDAGCRIFSTQNTGVIARSERRYDCSFAVVVRWRTGRFDCRLVLAPVVVCRDDRAVRIVQLERWIFERARHSCAGQRLRDMNLTSERVIAGRGEAVMRPVIGAAGECETYNVLDSSSKAIPRIVSVPTRAASGATAASLKESDQRT